MTSKIKLKLKNGDLVKVISGKYKGVVDYISKINLEKKTVYLKKASQKKYDTSSVENKKQSKEKEVMMPIHISNVAFWLEKEKTTTKIGYQFVEGNKKQRKSRKFNTLIN